MRILFAAILGGMFMDCTHLAPRTTGREATDG